MVFWWLLKTSNVAVLDVRLPDGDGVSVCRELRSRMPDLGCLMLTSFSDDEKMTALERDSLRLIFSFYAEPKVRTELSTRMSL